MKRVSQIKLSYANVVSTLCLFLLLGGSAYAATHLPRNSVGARQIRPNAVTGAKVKDQALSGADINASTLGQVPSAQSALHANSAAPTGTAGGDLGGSYPNPAIAPKAVGTAKLADGAVTAAKLASGIPHGVHVVNTLSGGASSNAEQSAQVLCPQGERVIGGGAFAPEVGATGFVALTSSGPLETSRNSSEFDGWRAVAIEVNGGSTQVWSVHVYVICAQL